MISQMLGLQFYPGSQRYPPGLERYPNRGFIGLIGNLPTIPDLIRLSRSIHKAGCLASGCLRLIEGLIVPQTRAIMLPLGSGIGNDGDGYGILRNPHYHQASVGLKL